MGTSNTNASFRDVIAGNGGTAANGGVTYDFTQLDALTTGLGEQLVSKHAVQVKQAAAYCPVLPCPACLPACKLQTLAQCQRLHSARRAGRCMCRAQQLLKTYLRTGAAVLRSHLRPHSLPATCHGSQLQRLRDLPWV